MKWLPQPTNFSEGQRAFYGCLVAFAGMFSGLVCMVFIGVFVVGVLWKVWPQERFEQILTILGYGFGGFIMAMIAVIMTLAVGGPVGRFKGGASIKDGFNLDLGDKEEGPIVNTTTTTTVTPPQGNAP